MADTTVQTEPGLRSSAQDASQHDPGAASAQAEPSSATVSGKSLTPAAPQPERPTPRIDGDDDEANNEDEDDEEGDDEFIPRGQSAHAASGGKPKGGRPR
ncbi:hypothetical protein GY45DRAFT_1373351 [Cubamyces sp. BRFM 1775]|nr:hypothetical protein GY45DRAFT_1373351 [Cubamyces sp. BRFM 1775]